MDISQISQLFHQRLTLGSVSSDLRLDESILDPTTAAGRLNRRLLEADGVSQLPERHGQGVQKIAIVSLLFNWPSTGGGIIHTAELAQFLTSDGFDVCHFYAVCRPWSVGIVNGTLPYDSCAIEFDETGWNREGIHSAFRYAVSDFCPDAVIVTDSWNTKGLLASAVSKFPYFIRLAAMECLCPLNNVRLLVDRVRGIQQCRKTQLSNRETCVTCVESHARNSGALHANERELAGFRDAAFDAELHTAFADAAGILVVNPLIGALCEPYARQVHVIPSGFDQRRFQQLPERDFADNGVRLLFAGLMAELMKGFHVLYEACCRLWDLGQDFELHVTSDPGQYDAPFLRYRGWKDQNELPCLMADVDIVVVPTVAQEALGRTAVEAMAASRPVVASRIGGLPYTVVDGFTGLLFEPGDADSLAEHLLRLMTDRELALALGKAGRERFLSEYTWEQIIATKYRPLFSSMRSHS
ncbi:MAG: glycosyltransferase family 4 protein [Planctomycetaceae bacterium]